MVKHPKSPPPADKPAADPPEQNPDAPPVCPWCKTVCEIDPKGSSLFAVRYHCMNKTCGSPHSESRAHRAGDPPKCPTCKVECEVVKGLPKMFGHLYQCPGSCSFQIQVPHHVAAAKREAEQRS
jgi:hypothetical protein